MDSTSCANSSGWPIRFGNCDAGHEVVLHLLRRTEHERRPHRAGGDGAHPDAHGGEVARHRERHAEDGCLGRAVGHLAGLALQAGDGGGVHDDPSLAVVVRVVDDMAAAARRRHVEGAHRVHVHRGGEGALVVRGAVASDGASAADAAASDVHHERQRPEASSRRWRRPRRRRRSHPRRPRRPRGRARRRARARARGLGRRWPRRRLGRPVGGPWHPQAARSAGDDRCSPTSSMAREPSTPR